MDDLPFEVYLSKGQSGLGMSLTGGDNGGMCVVNLRVKRVNFRPKPAQQFSYRVFFIFYSWQLKFRTKLDCNYCINHCKYPIVRVFSLIVVSVFDIVVSFITNI